MTDSNNGDKWLSDALWALHDQFIPSDSEGCDQVNISVAGREFILDKPAAGGFTYKEIKPVRRRVIEESFTSLFDFCEATRRYGDPDKTIIKVMPRGILAMLDATADEDQRTGTLSVPFFSEDMPQAPPMNYEQFLEWIDQVAQVGPDGQPGIQDLELLTSAVRSLTVSKGDEIKLEDRGAYTAVVATAKSGDLGETKIPKYIQTRIRFGVREFIISVKFRLRVNTEKLTWQLTHLVRDGAIDEYMTTAKQVIQGHLGEGWAVYLGA